MRRDLLCLVVVLLCWCEGGAGQPEANVTIEAGAYGKQARADGRRECDKIDGSYYFPSGRQCLKLLRFDIRFEPARKMCREAGGDIWRPDLSDPDLVKKLATEVPVILTALNKDFWVGLKTKHGGLFNLNEQDVTNTYFGVLSDVSHGGVAHGGCVILDFKDGFPRFKAKQCAHEDKTDFLCEFPVSK